MQSTLWMLIKRKWKKYSLQHSHLTGKQPSRCPKAQYNTLTWYDFEGVYDPTYLNLDINDRDSWKIYADKVRDLIANVLNAEKTNLEFKDVEKFTEIYETELKK